MELNVQRYLRSGVSLVAFVLFLGCDFNTMPKKWRIHSTGPSGDNTTFLEFSSEKTPEFLYLAMPHGKLQIGNFGDRLMFVYDDGEYNDKHRTFTSHFRCPVNKDSFQSISVATHVYDGSYPPYGIARVNFTITCE